MNKETYTFKAKDDDEMSIAWLFLGIGAVLFGFYAYDKETYINTLENTIRSPIEYCKTRYNAEAVSTGRYEAYYMLDSYVIVLPIYECRINKETK